MLTQAPNNDKPSLGDTYAQIRKMAADMALPSMYITGNQSRSSFPNMYYDPAALGGVKAGHLSTIMAKPGRCKTMYYIDYESMANDDFIAKLLSDKPTVVTDSLIMCQRARKIFDSFTGPEKSDVNAKKYIYMTSDSPDIRFEITHSALFSFNAKSVELFIGNIIIPISIKDLPFGMNMFSSTTRDPKNAVANIEGEITDFVIDYFDEFGYYADE